MQQPTTNDLSFQAATVNGSGSQSANLVLTRAIFSMGIPVAPKNVFPSNIEGLPTWYQLRISPQGYQARTGDPDVVVALNPQTWKDDLATGRSGGAVIHEEAYAVPDGREDLTYYPVPFAKLAKARIENDALRKQLTNMIYVGVVGGLLGIPKEALEVGVQRTFQTKPKAWQSNLDAIQVGYEYWEEHFQDRPCGHRLEPMSGKTEGLVLIEGNQAAALGCVMGGCTVAAWYPITPSSSLCENLITYAERFRADRKNGEKKIAIVQAEDELAALGDVSFTYTLSHGDTRHVVLLPGTAEDCYEFAQAAFDLADRFQTPVFVLSDLDLGMNLWMTPPFKYPEKPFDRGKVLSAT